MSKSELLQRVMDSATLLGFEPRIVDSNTSVLIQQADGSRVLVVPTPYLVDEKRGLEVHNVHVRVRNSGMGNGEEYLREGGTKKVFSSVELLFKTLVDRDPESYTIYTDEVEISGQ